MSALRMHKAGSRRGRKALARLEGRADEVLGRKLMKRAGAIVEQVRRRGDKGLLEAVRRHDGVRVGSVAELRLEAGEVQATDEALPVGFAEGLERSIAAVERFHRPQVRQGYVLDEGGMTLEARVTPLRRVGVYVPGGRASYPSTVLMTVIPARLAGVEQIAVATPLASFRRSAALRYTLGRLGVEEIWGVGGAQAVAAFAYGTETIERVDKIVGPGNAWVTAAKQHAVRDVAIDGLAGPTEVLVVASAGAAADLVAADLLAQAEHDPYAAAVLVTPSKSLARQVVGEVDRQLEELPERSPAHASIRRFGVALVVGDLEEAVDLVERIAPEHLQLVGAEAEELATRSLSAGAVFVGEATPEVLGDYVAGPSHVLPTCGSARWASALGVADFLRRSHVVRCAPGEASRWAAAAVAMAEAEGLPAHVASAVRRLR